MGEQIIVSKLVKQYRDKTVLDGVDLVVHRNECIGIIGKNGAGKTTLLECIEGIRKWQKGEITISGHKIPDTRNHLRNTMGIQLQSASLPDEIKVREAIELFAAEHYVHYSFDEKSLFGMAALLQKRYKELSTGQKRRLHLLLATLHNPDIIILDEPTAGLDIEGKEELYQIIGEYKTKGKTILVTSHDLTEVELLCDRVLMIDAGTLIEIGDIAHSKLREAKTTLIIKTVNGSLREGFASVFGTANESPQGDVIEYKCSNITKFIRDITAFIDDNDDCILDISLKNKSLKDKFFETIEGEEQL
ncbi:MAG: ABC transporter ATP-binding protein [Coriobacteriales bacterium]|nr:ABC transporter ATP-binding protein [Coriobacteriales bacterium]